jgi:murein DD-endopeptidase MepM/ murein hydrolase activator NlpD
VTFPLLSLRLPRSLELPWSLYMGDHRAGVPGTTATSLTATGGRRAAASPGEQRTSQPYRGRRVAQSPASVPDDVRDVEALPYAGRRVAGRDPVRRTPSHAMAPVGRRIALDVELSGLGGDADDVVGHLLSPTSATPTLDAYVGRRIARTVDLITGPAVDEPVIVDPVANAPLLVAPVVDLVEDTIVPEPVVETIVVAEPAIEAPLLSLPVVEELVLDLPVLEEAAEVEEPVVETTVLEAAEMVEPVLAAHPELTIETPAPPVTQAKRTRPGGRRVASRRTRVPSLPLLAGVAVLAVSAGGALQAVNPGLAGVDTNGRITPASALSGSSAVGSASLLGGRGASVSRSSDRTDGSDSLQAAADAAAKERDAALTAIDGQAAKRAAQIKLHQWVLPVAPGVYHLTARFGDYSSLWSHFHTGLDFAAPTGTPILAVAGGTITETGYSGAYGNRTIETLPDGTELWYCHQNEFGTSVGATVKPGQVIGYIGSTGNVTGPHLHLEVHPGGGDPVDPYTALVVHGLQP